MKRAVACSLLAALSVFVVPLAQAQSQGMGAMDMKSDKKGKSQTHQGSGTVSKVDSEKGTVTIAHGPVESMKWPAMSMTFKVKDKKMLDNVSANEKVDFQFMQQGKDYVITSLK